jgi:glycosyltransferase involved in cell wall biosynthesis
VTVRVLERRDGVRPPYLAPPLEVFHALRDAPPDVAIVNDWRGLGYAAQRARQLGIALGQTAFVVHCHGPGRVLAEFAHKVPDTADRFGEGVAERASLELSDAVVSPSNWLLGWMREHGWPVPDNARVIPYITQSAALDESPEGGPGAAPIERMAFFGQLREGKGIRIFLEALAELEPELLEGVELSFLGSERARWTGDRILDALAPPVREHVAGVHIETDLDRDAALERLRRPGTLAVMPSLLDNSPNAVYECLERGIPFVASNVGGIPELVAPEDRERVLFEPTPSGVAAAIGSALVEGRVPKPPRRAFDPSESFARWSEVVALQPKPQPTSPGDDVDVVLVRRNKSRTAGLQSGTAPYVIFLDEEDILEPEALSTLVRAQRASGADVVTCGLRVVSDGGDSSLHFFFGEPRGLGVLANDYGNVALYRRAVLDDLATSWPVEQDEDWPLLARLSLAGARIVSVPAPLVTRHIRPGSIERDPSDALLVVHEMERALPERLRSTVRLVAGLAAAAAASAPPSPAPSARRMYRRLFRGAR